MTDIFIGTSGWAYKAWQPGFFPEKLPQKQFLRYYAEQLNAVEVNYTFRHLLSEKTIAGWLAATPQGFRFAVKAHQSITHFRRLKNAEEPLRSFLSSIEPLASAGRLGPVLFQLPPLFKSDPETLERFLALLPRTLNAAFEFRDVSWFDERVYETLRKHGAALCMAENEKLETPPIVTSNFAYFRYRKPGYTGRQRQSIVENMAAMPEKTGEVYAFFKHEESPESALTAMDVLRRLATAGRKKAG